MSVASNAALSDGAARRILAALGAIMPVSAKLEVVDVTEPATMTVRVGSRTLFTRWIGRGSVRTVRQTLALRPKADVIVASELSLAAREAASDAGVGWVDETGAAEIVAGEVVVSRTGRASSAHPRRLPGPDRWSPAILSVAEALLCGTRATASATAMATGHSPSSTAHALAFLTNLGLLQAHAARGRHSGRRVADPDLLLDRYAEAARGLRPSAQLRCGVLWGQDPLAQLERLGERWDRAGVRWASTGILAAAVLAPHLAGTTGGEVYVEASSDPALRNAARHAGVEQIEGGRLLLRAFPTVASDHLATKVGRLWIAPWPRVYADLQDAGVRGEEAAEHLRETMRD
ncbi:MAG: hypothetical protein ACRDK2_09610 [Solirubrobacteraceae bacterium]